MSPSGQGFVDTWAEQGGVNIVPCSRLFISKEKSLKITILEKKNLDKLAHE
jgi:hypothetical protein